MKDFGAMDLCADRFAWMVLQNEPYAYASHLVDEHVVCHDALFFECCEISVDVSSLHEDDASHLGGSPHLVVIPEKVCFLSLFLFAHIFGFMDSE